MIQRPCFTEDEKQKSTYHCGIQLRWRTGWRRCYSAALSVACWSGSLRSTGSASHPGVSRKRVSLPGLVAAGFWMQMRGLQTRIWLWFWEVLHVCAGCASWQVWPHKHPCLAEGELMRTHQWVRHLELCVTCPVPWSSRPEVFKSPHRNFLGNGDHCGCVHSCATVYMEERSWNTLLNCRMWAEMLCGLVPVFSSSLLRALTTFFTLMMNCVAASMREEITSSKWYVMSITNLKN